MRTTEKPRWPDRGEIARVLPIVGLGLFQVVGTHFAAQRQPDGRSLDALAYALVSAGPLLLLARRKYPGPVLLAVFATTLTYWLFGYPRGPIFLSLGVALFSAFIAGQRRLAWATLGAGYVCFPWVPYLLGNKPRPSLGALVASAAWLLLLGTLAETIRARRERMREAARIRAEEARRRASEERLRIARELHDVLAHNISLINVQAGVALHLIDEQPEQARTALAAIKQASKDALGELRSVLDVLRQADEQPPRSPASGLNRLDELVSRARAAGLPVNTQIDGVSHSLPASVDLAAFRIVQEALTNITRHAGPAVATVRLAFTDDELIVQVDDNGRGAPATGGNRTRGGNGIPGMRERATALGGELTAGPRPGGGFRVRARLPVKVDRNGAA